MTRVKICGITNIDDAISAQEFGADALGFIFYSKSKRNILPEKAFEIVQELNPFINKVGVFVNSTPQEINKIAAYCGLTQIQLHGDETVELAQTLQLPVIRALNFNSQLSGKIDKWRNYSLLIDSGNEETRGGTGQIIPWKKLKNMTGSSQIILAGGLTASNIKEALEIINPNAVDVSSGVEKSPGIKDKHLVKQFIELVKA